MRTVFFSAFALLLLGAAPPVGADEAPPPDGTAEPRVAEPSTAAPPVAALSSTAPAAAAPGPAVEEGVDAEQALARRAGDGEGRLRVARRGRDPGDAEPPLEPPRVVRQPRLRSGLRRVGARRRGAARPALCGARQGQRGARHARPLRPRLGERG